MFITVTTTGKSCGPERENTNHQTSPVSADGPEEMQRKRHGGHLRSVIVTTVKFDASHKYYCTNNDLISVFHYLAPFSSLQGRPGGGIWIQSLLCLVKCGGRLGLL